MASTATGHRTREDGSIEIVVVHRDTDSYSRSVDLAARKYLRAGKAGAFTSATLINGSRYSAEETYAARDPRKWWVSFIAVQINR